MEFEAQKGGSLRRWDRSLEKGFRDYCHRRGLLSDAVDAIMPFIAQFDRFLESLGTDMESAKEQDLRAYFEHLLADGAVPVQAVRAAVLCGLFLRNDEIAVYAISRRSADGVVRALRRRVEEVAGKEFCEAAFEDLDLPPLGSPPEAHSAFTGKLVRKLGTRLPEQACRHLLTCNAHDIPVAAFEEEKKRYRASRCLDEYLRGRHHRLVDELVQSAASGELWYEQRITPSVVEHVRNHPEIQAGVRDGRIIYVTKIPFAPQAYLDAKDPLMKRYYGCHCPVARESILSSGEGVPPVFCYCSGGFEKLPFDVIFGQPVEVKVMESALAGDLRCRFAITVPDGVDIEPC